eukprot:CAMPEP_0204902036 /NCGR_PEP_ID=MMETSP1397-20131031/3430_1 /ASSEMBLY_ACC=CAM_ASM_000891 /TAXON_ID=49980 /ORGANISM="Climacostomum Climacostomum virens, Strain Stock W-24" /LENGTH=312 /DNA_ID=CAMNT_0052070479 /DNA_START=371 /DNA_END=1306 /DNA_ORIENTATION=+
MDEDTQAFLARHRSNTSRYMNKLNISKDKPEKLDASATLKRLQDKYGLTPERTERPERSEEVRVSLDEQNIQDFIKSVRLKYLGDKVLPQTASKEESPKLRETSPAVSKDIPKSPVKTKPLVETELPGQDVKRTVVHEPLIDLTSPVKEPLDLLSGPDMNDLLSLNLNFAKPPSSPLRSPKGSPKRSPVRSPLRSPNKSPLRSPAKLSPRTENIISTLISNTVGKKLGLCRKKPEKKRTSKQEAKLRTFDAYLASKRTSPVRTTRHKDIAQVYINDPELQALVKREQVLVERLRALKKEKGELVERERQTNY